MASTPHRPTIDQRPTKEGGHRYGPQYVQPPSHSKWVETAFTLQHWICVPQVSTLCLLEAGCRIPILTQAASRLFTAGLGDCLPAQCSTPEHRSWSLSIALAKEAPTKAEMATSLPLQTRAQDSQDLLHLPHIINKQTKRILFDATEGNLG